VLRRDLIVGLSGIRVHPTCVDFNPPSAALPITRLWAGRVPANRVRGVVGLWPFEQSRKCLQDIEDVVLPLSAPL